MSVRTAKSNSRLYDYSKNGEVWENYYRKRKKPRSEEEYKDENPAVDVSCQVVKAATCQVPFRNVGVESKKRKSREEQGVYPNKENHCDCTGFSNFPGRIHGMEYGWSSIYCNHCECHDRSCSCQTSNKSVKLASWQNPIKVTIKFRLRWGSENCRSMTFNFNQNFSQLSALVSEGEELINGIELNRNSLSK